MGVYCEQSYAEGNMANGGGESFVYERVVDVVVVVYIYPLVKRDKTRRRRRSPTILLGNRTRSSLVTHRLSRELLSITFFSIGGKNTQRLCGIRSDGFGRRRRRNTRNLKDERRMRIIFRDPSIYSRLLMATSAHQFGNDRRRNHHSYVINNDGTSQPAQTDVTTHTHTHTYTVLYYE